MSEHSAGTATTEPPAELSVDSIRVATGPVLQRLVATAAEREQTRDYAFDEVRVLAEQGITLTGIATADGGAGGSLRDVTDLVVEIARVDSNVAQALRGSFLVANKVATRYDLPNREVTLHRLRNGDLFAGTVNERNGSSSGTVTTTLHRSGVGYLLKARSTTQQVACMPRGSPAQRRTSTAMSWTSRCRWIARECACSTTSTPSAND